MHKILIADDEPDILEFISYNLRKDGYEVACAGDGKEALKIANTFLPDIIILDIMMPEMDGIETCQNLRKDPKFRDTMIMILTARGEDYSQIAGFDAGADDYVTKPIKPKVLISRIQALLRRSKNTAPEILGESDIIIDRDRYTVVISGEDHQLPRKEFELLALLVSKPGRVFTRHDILEMIWGNDVVVGDRTIDVHIRKLRERIGDDKIRTVKGIGYTFNS